MECLIGDIWSSFFYVFLCFFRWIKFESGIGSIYLIFLLNKYWRILLLTLESALQGLYIHFNIMYITFSFIRCHGNRMNHKQGDVNTVLWTPYFLRHALVFIFCITREPMIISLGMVHKFLYSLNTPRYLEENVKKINNEVLPVPWHDEVISFCGYDLKWFFWLSFLCIFVTRHYWINV